MATIIRMTTWRCYRCGTPWLIHPTRDDQTWCPICDFDRVPRTLSTAQAKVRDIDVAAALAEQITCPHCGGNFTLPVRK